MKLKTGLAGLAGMMLAAAAAQAQVSDDVVKIGVLNDQSGLYADIGGQGAVTAARIRRPRPQHAAVRNEAPRRFQGPDDAVHRRRHGRRHVRGAALKY